MCSLLLTLKLQSVLSKIILNLWNCINVENLRKMWYKHITHPALFTCQRYKLISYLHEMKAHEISFLLVILCIEELTWHEAIKSMSSVLLNRQWVKFVTDNHFISCDLFIYYLNQTGMMSKMEVSNSWLELVSMAKLP